MAGLLERAPVALPRTYFTRTAPKTLGDECHAIGASALLLRGLPEAYILPGLQIREKFHEEEVRSSSNSEQLNKRLLYRSCADGGRRWT